LEKTFPWTRAKVTRCALLLNVFDDVAGGMLFVEFEVFAVDFCYSLDTVMWYYK
jgi:hypothetical protein